MLKWHPNKDEIYAADLCLKELGISRDIRSCIKFYLFDKYCVTDKIFSTFNVTWKEQQILMYECFQKNRINFIVSERRKGNSFLVDHIAAACYKTGLSTVVVTTGKRRVFKHLDNVKQILGEIMLNHNLILGVTSSPAVEKDLHHFQTQIIFIDDYDHMEFTELYNILEEYIYQRNVHIFAVRGNTLSQHEHLLTDMYKHFQNVVHVVSLETVKNPGPMWISSEKVRRLKELYVNTKPEEEEEE